MFKSVSTMVPVVDVARALKFYTETLELEEVKSNAPSPMVRCPDGTMVILYERAPTKADHNSAIFEVDDIEAAVKTLKSRGVRFEEVEMPEQGIKTVDGIATMGDVKGAWFRDTEGNTFMIGQM